MLTIQVIPALRARIGEWRRLGERIALVPTMGNLHAGHLRLVTHAQASAVRVVVSIFVNPMQFDRAADLAAYPRTFKEDCQQLSDVGTDVLFAPGVDIVYPHGMENATRVEVPQLSNILEGASRPGHFIGVATVVTKLLNIVQPDMAIFGEKDYQQLLVIRRLVADLDLPIEIVGRPTVRETDGLAMSSRNRYLTAEERTRAPALYVALRRVADRIREGERDYADLVQEASRKLQAQGFGPDYVCVRRAQDLAAPETIDRELVVLGAAWLGRARLIDNIRLTLPQDRLSPIMRRPPEAGHSPGAH